MKYTKICNCCHELFNDNSIKQLSRCSECKEGDIIFINEAEYLKVGTDEEKQTFLENLVQFGQIDSLRYFNVHAIFNKKNNAEIFIQEIKKKDLITSVSVKVNAGNWEVTGFTKATLRECPQLTKEMKKIFKIFNSQMLSYWTGIEFG